MKRNYRNIKAWQYADDLTVQVYSKTKSFPKEELYGLVSQVRRAVVSVATNIVEGASRETDKDFARFLVIARASLAEVEYLLQLSNKLELLSLSDYEMLEGLRQTTAKTLVGLIKAVNA